MLLFCDALGPPLAFFRALALPVTPLAPGRALVAFGATGLVLVERPAAPPAPAPAAVFTLAVPAGSLGELVPALLSPPASARLEGAIEHRATGAVATLAVDALPSALFALVEPPDEPPPPRAPLA